MKTEEGEIDTAGKEIRTSHFLKSEIKKRSKMQQVRQQLWEGINRVTVKVPVLVPNGKVDYLK